ncbi:mandelate racemase/muconate lactonizing enzyme family protein [Prosthecomicrobium pneumaticum]|uniref:mandelate racemase/muconate lactonizing enzyme family protein n=1 Tax=Prosthecomicrobium pneumaticum TaxID=81895 RepID=UPI003CCC9EA0
MPPLKIAKVEPLLIDIFLFVRITTDNGLVGLGESGTWGHLEASAAAVAKFGEYLVGKDAGAIEHHWNVMHRSNHFTGAAINGALSAIDIALWDLKGKALGVPVYELLGGRYRHKARVYAWVKGRNTDELVEESAKRKAEGYTAIGHLNPFLDESETSTYFQTHAARMDAAIDRIRRVREAVGPEVDICLELHRRLTVPEAVTLGRALEPYHPYFYEDPLKPASPDAMAWVADHIPLPVATGERFINLQQFQTLLARRGVEFLRTSLAICGGITGGRKIAALAEASDAQIIPHNPVSPVGLAACLQLAAAIPNFAIQEYPIGTPHIDGRKGLVGEDFLIGTPKAENGFITISDAPGLGIALAPEAEKRFPPRRRSIQHIHARLHADGSVLDH